MRSGRAPFAGTDVSLVHLFGCARREALGGGLTDAVVVGHRTMTYLFLALASPACHICLCSESPRFFDVQVRGLVCTGIALFNVFVQQQLVWRRVGWGGVGRGGSGVLLKDPGVLLKDPGVLLKVPGILLKDPGVPALAVLLGGGGGGPEPAGRVRGRPGARRAGAGESGGGAGQ